ncbi:MAG: Ig-like domain-containing protein [Bacteroidales bacterium]|nr:Ig-like domain-containing protein [Bacteroidales bacterium]
MKNLLYSVMILSFAFAISCDKEPQRETESTAVESVTLNQIATIFNVDDTLMLIATVLPNNAINKTVTWSSSDTVVATVDSNGLVTAVSAGNATIIVTTQDGEKTATCVVTVSKTTWETSLGKASFATDFTWKISGNSITQEWSDAVQTVDCSSKTTFSGGNSTSGFNIDCRSNPGQKGDLFSWRAVKEVAEICPDGWRVPTSQDFIDLDIALDFNGQNRYQETVKDTSWQVQLNTYLTIWGGAYGGSCYSDGSLLNQGFFGIYWSQSESSTALGFLLSFNTGGYIYPQNWGSKGSGYVLRCVK